MADVPESVAVSDSGFTLPTSEILTGRGFITGKSGSGKSVLEGTIVYTEAGRKPIEDVVAGEKVLSLNKHDYQQEFREVLATIEHESDELVRITLEDGTTLVGTEDHSFLTVENLEIVPIRGDELEVGTWFPLARELPSAETVTRIDLADYITASRDIDINDDSIRSGQKTAERFVDLDFESGAVLGLFLAEGSFDSRLTVQISNIDDGPREFLGGQGFKVYERTCNRAYRPFGEFVQAEFGRGAADKSLPNWVFDAPAGFRAGLLSGYLDGDGSVDDDVTMVSKSPALLAGIKELLRQFGISATLRETFTVDNGDGRGYRRLRVDAYCIERLHEVVTLSIDRKAAALDQLVADRESGACFNSKDMIPGFGPVLTHAAREQGWTKRASDHRVAGASAQLLTRKQKAGRETYNRFVEDLVVDGRAARFGRSDIQWQRVVDIEPLSERRTVYDLDVRLNDNFVADSVFVHNSNTASVIAEELLEHGLPLLIVDTDGEYYGLKTRYELLHVGAEADCDATVSVEHAEKLAELALLQNIPIILDISGFVEEAERQELVRRVVERLFELGKQVRKPFLVFLEEVHEFLPQSGTTDELSDTLITVAKRGRKRGIGLCGMSQRPAAVDKEYITQCDWVVWHRLTWDNDKRVASQMLGNDVASGIDDLETGEGLLMTDWDDRINRVRFRRKRTFDAGATPGLDDIDGGTYSPVSSALISELSGDDADLNDIDVDELPGARDSTDDIARAEDDAAGDGSPPELDAEEAAESALEAAPVENPGTDVVTIPSRPSSRPTYTPPEPAEDEAFDPVWELGHLTVYLFSRLVAATTAGAAAGVRGVVVGGRQSARAARWFDRRLRRDVERAGRTVRQRLVAPSIRGLEGVAASGLSDRLIAGAVITLLVIAIALLLLS